MDIAPKAWMADVLARLPKVTASRVHALLPGDWKAEVKAVKAAQPPLSPDACRRNALFARQDEGGRNWARFASRIGTGKTNGVAPFAYMKKLFTKLASGHLDTDSDEPIPLAYAQPTTTSKYSSGTLQRIRDTRPHQKNR